MAHSSSRNRSPSANSAHLELPRRSTELHDPGAPGLESSEEDYFSDASEGRKRKISRPQTPASPIPTTRVEKVDDEPRHGEVPGTSAYDKRKQDAVPDEVEVVQEGRLSKRGSRQFLEPTSPGGSHVPRTVVEKLDPESPSYGEVPGTDAYKMRLADASPDIILKTPDPAKGPHYKEDFSHRRTPSGNPIPETIVTRFDDQGEGDRSGSPTLDRSTLDGPTRRRSTMKSFDGGTTNEKTDNDDDGFGDDFDDFEEGAEAGADDDFGDFDDGFGESTPSNQHTQHHGPSSSFPLVDFDAFESLYDLLDASKQHLDTMFPTTTSEHQSTLTKPTPIPSDSPVFPSERSRSLWKQLVTPPPLQPPNWTQSRIRRLFLISLGVPVDLDEILPPSKQKKLILPGLEPTSDPSDGKDTLSRLRSQKDNASSTSLAESTSSQPGTGKSKPKRSTTNNKQNPPPPQLDLLHVKRVCATTEEKLDNLSDQELKDHVKELEELTEKTREVLEYWLKRRDSLRKEKEAFEGVIQNLVRHMNRVRK